MFCAFRRVTVRATAALLLLTVLAGLPAALVVFIGWPLPSRIPAGDQLGAWVTTPVTDAVVLNALAVAAWLLWAAFLHAIAAEARAAWRGLPTRATTGRTANPLRLAAASLITALTLGTLFSGAAAAAVPATAQARPPAVHVVTANQPPAVARQGPATFHVDADSYSYVVERRDTLSKISDVWLGDANRWPEICELNRHRHFAKVGGTMRDCNLIYPGWNLRLPADAKPPADATPTPASPPPAAEPKPHPGPTQPTTPAPSGSSTAPTEDPDGVVEPPSAKPSASATTTAPGALPTPTTSTAPTAPSPPATASSPTVSPTTPQSPTSTASQTDDGAIDSPAADEDGVHLPGGSFVPWTLAAAIVAAAAMVWLQRQRRFIPGTHDEDDEPADLPPPVTHLRRHVIRNPDLPTPTDLAERAAAVPALPLLPPGGVGLVGDGAHAAARAALISSLASGGPREPDRRGEVVIDGTTLTTLIGADAAVLGSWPRLHVADDIDHALSILDSRLLHRARVLDEHSLTDLHSLRESSPDEEALPPVLLICEAPPAGARMRARVSFGLGNGLDVSALLLGEWPHGSTIEVTTDGHTRVADGSAVEAIGDRVAVLDTTEAVAILTTLRESHTGEPPNPVVQATATPRPPAPASDPAPTSSALSNPATNTDEAADAEPSDRSLDAPPPVDGNQRIKASLRVLGAPVVEDLVLPGRDLRGRAAELAVFLACHPDGADTETIAEHLVPEVRRRQAKQLVHTNASNLRHVLGRASGPITAGYVLKRGASARYRLDPTTVRVDLWQLRDLLTRARLASAPARTDLLRDACDLYTAPLADGCDYEWVEPHREKARQWGTEAHLGLADDLIESDPQAASELLDKAIGLDRYNEQLYRKAMQARHAISDADGIRALLRALTQALADLDAEPAETTVELAAKLRTSLEQQ